VDGLGTFRHERGPSLLLLKEEYLDVFRDCITTDSTGADAGKDYGLEIRQCIPGYQVVFDDGDRVHLGFPKNTDGEPTMASSVRMAEVVSRGKMDGFEEDGAIKWDAYMRACSAFLDCGLPNFIEEELDLGSFPKFFVEALRDWFKVCACLWR